MPWPRVPFLESLGDAGPFSCFLRHGWAGLARIQEQRGMWRASLAWGGEYPQGAGIQPCPGTFTLHLKDMKKNSKPDRSWQCAQCGSNVSGPPTACCKAGVFDPEDKPSPNSLRRPVLWIPKGTTPEAYQREIGTRRF